MFALIVIFTAAKFAELVAEDKFIVDVMSIEEEILLGEQEHIKKIEHSGVYDDPKLAAYVEEIGTTLLRAAPIEGIEPTFTITNSGVGSAKALPGGYIYIDRAYLGFINNEAELAAALAHELGHMAARDAAKSYSLGIADPCRDAAASPLDKMTIERIYHQSEFKADAYAVRMLLRTGYDPMALAALLAPTQLQEFEVPTSYGEDADEESCLSTHPTDEDRISRIEEIIEKAEPKAFRRGRELYLSKIDNIAWGLNSKLIIGTDEYSDLEFNIKTGRHIADSDTIARSKQGHLGIHLP